MIRYSSRFSWRLRLLSRRGLAEVCRVFFVVCNVPHPLNNMVLRPHCRGNPPGERVASGVLPVFDISITPDCEKCKKPYLSAGTILDKTVNTHGNFTGISNHSNFVPNSKKVHSAQKVSAIRKIFDVSDKMERFTKPGACATLTAERTLRGKGRERWNSMKKGKTGKRKPFQPYSGCICPMWLSA